MDLRSVGARCVRLHDGERRLLPREVKALEQLLPAALRAQPNAREAAELVEKAMLGGEGGVGGLGKGALHHRALLP